MNALTEAKIIRALYRASRAGVKVQLVIRGICCLRPGIEGLSENIEVRSMLGRFLEHSRLFYFANNGEPELFASSADWMDRNLFHRVETCFPILISNNSKRMLEESLELPFAEHVQAWIMQADGSYVFSDSKADANGKNKPLKRHQEILLKKAKR